MFKYGHMIDVNDELDVELADGTKEHVIVLDKWISRQTRDTMWLELWSTGPDVIARPVMIRRVGAFQTFSGVTRKAA